MKTSKEQLRELLARCEMAHETEKARFARILHDDLSQKLTALLIELSLLESAFPPNSKEARKIGELSGIVSSIGTSVRKMTNELRLKILEEFGLAAAIKHQVERWKKEENVSVLISRELGEFEMDGALAAGIFKMFQEVVLAFMKQKVSQLSVEIEDNQETFSIRLFESGTTKPCRTVFADEPMHLLSLQEHALRLNGEVKLVKAKRTGMEVQLIFSKQARRRLLT